MEIFIQMLRQKTVEYIERLDSLERQLRQSNSPDEIHQIFESINEINQGYRIINQIIMFLSSPNNKYTREEMKHAA